MNITVIIPVHEYNEKIKELYRNALNTIVEQKKAEIPKVLVVYASSLVNNEEDGFVNNEVHRTIDGLSIQYIKNEDKTDFQSQINLGVKSVDTEYFSILEFDDEYSTTYFKNAVEHIEAFPEVDLFIPIVVEVNDKRQRLKFTNETVWAKQFVGENGEMGYLNSKSLNQYTDFKITGGIFKKEEYENAGGLKSNIELTFIYEFLLRMLNNGAVIYTIPKAGYMHLATREGGLFDTYGKTMTLNHRKFWFDTAKKEYSFFNDREIDMSLLDTSVPPTQ